MNTTHAILATSLALCSLAAPGAAQRMIACDSSRAVHEIDIATGARTPLGTISANASTSAGFAYDWVAGKLYLTSTGNDALYVIDVTNWDATLVGNFGLGTVPVMHGLEWDLSTNTLYGMSSHNQSLYTIDTTTGLATLVGATGLTGGFPNLGYDPITNTMWMTSGGSDSLYSIDRGTGAVTLVGPLTGPTNPNGLAYNVDNQTLYLIDNSTDLFYSIDTTTGLATAIGPPVSSNLLGLAYIPGAGRLTRAVHGCGATTINVTGHPAIGSAIEFTVGASTAFPFVGFGITSIGFPFCNCMIGHEWSVALFGSVVPLPIPPNPGLIGVSVYAQGMDFLGAGGCPSPTLTLTDTITLSIG